MLDYYSPYHINLIFLLQELIGSYPVKIFSSNSDKNNAFEVNFSLNRSILIETHYGQILIYEQKLDKKNIYSDCKKIERERRTIVNNIYIEHVYNRFSAIYFSMDNNSALKFYTDEISSHLVGSVVINEMDFWDPNDLEEGKFINISDYKSFLSELD